MVSAPTRMQSGLSNRHPHYSLDYLIAAERGESSACWPIPYHFVRRSLANSSCVTDLLYQRNDGAVDG